MKRNLVSRFVATGLVATAVCMAAGCATTDTVSSRFPQLEENINAAKAAEADLYAPAPLKSAEAKLGEAKAAVAAGDMASANKLVDEAMADAEFALAKAPTEKSKNEAVKLSQEIEALRGEIKRMPVAKQ